MNNCKIKHGIVFFLASFVSGVVYGLPEGEQITAGQADFQSTVNSLRIDQQSRSLIINYDSFNIGQGELVEFVQPDGGIVLNRVTGGSISEIFGQLRANGNIILLNPNGILFGASSQVDVGGLIATTLSIRDEDFLSGRFTLVDDKTINLSGIENHGHLEAHSQGYIALIAPEVSNSGTVIAHLGEVVFAGADSININFDQTGGIGIELDQATINTLVENKGVIQADGGNIQLLAAQVSEVLSSLVDNSGVVEAKSLTLSEGRIFLSGGDVFNTGNLSTSAADVDTAGGTIIVDANRIAQFGEISSHGKGNGDGGSIYLGAQEVVVLGSGSLTAADADQTAGGTGNGGEAIVFSPGDALFRNHANMSARGGASGGDGGFLEVSGLEYVEIFGLVDTRAPMGNTGQFLIDPHDVTINSGADANGSFDAGNPNTFTPSASGANVDVATLQTNLQASSVTITTTSGGGEAGDLAVDTVIDLDGTDGNTLTLMADDDIIVNFDIKDLTPGTPDATNVTFAAADDYLFVANIEVETNGGTIRMTGDSVFMNDNSLLDSGNGIIDIDLTGFINIGGLRSTNTTASAIDIVASGISDTGDTYIDIVANQPGAVVNLTIGTAINSIETSIATLSGSTAGAGNVIISETDAITVSSFTTNDGAFSLTSGGTQTITNLVVGDAGDNQTHDLTLNATAGNLVLGTVTADADLFLTTTAGNVTDNNGAVNNLTGDTLTLSIGGAMTDIETDVATITGSTTAAGNVSLNETDAVAVTSFATNDGSFSLTSGGTQTITTITANDAGADEEHDVTLTATAGNLLISTITADDDITLNTTAGTVTDNNGATNNLTGDTVNFTIAGAITDIETNVAALSGSSTAAGDISFTETDAVDVTLSNTNGSVAVTAAGTITATSVDITTNPGSVTLTSTGANILVGEIDANNQGAVTLNANAGSILDANLNGNPNIADVNTTLTLSALDRIGDITSFATATGDALRLSGINQINATTTAVGSDIYLSGDIPIAGSTFTPDADGSASLLLNKTDGALDMTTGTFNLSAGDNIGFISNTTLTIFGAGISTTGDLYLQATNDIVDTSGRDLMLTADNLIFTSGMNGGDVILTTDIATLTGSTTGAGNVTVNENDAITVSNFSTNNGSLSLNSGDTQTITGITVNNGSLTSVAQTGNLVVAGDITATSINAPSSGIVSLTSDTGDLLVGTGVADVTIDPEFSSSAPALILAANGPNSLIQVGGATNTVVLEVPREGINVLVPNSTQNPAVTANSFILEVQLGLRQETMPESPVSEQLTLLDTLSLADTPRSFYNALPSLRKILQPSNILINDCVPSQNNACDNKEKAKF